MFFKLEALSHLEHSGCDKLQQDLTSTIKLTNWSPVCTKFFADMSYLGTADGLYSLLGDFPTIFECLKFTGSAKRHI